MSTNRALLHGRWLEFRDRVQREWSVLPAHEIDRAEGRLDRLVDSLRGHYGLPRSEAEARLRELQRQAGASDEVGD